LGYPIFEAAHCCKRISFLEINYLNAEHLGTCLLAG